MSYSAAYVRCFRALMELEGWDVYSNHPEDEGGGTRFGISELAFPNEDIAGLTVECAMALYKSYWWDLQLLDSVLNEAIAFQLFESSVHMDGPDAVIRRSVRIAQWALKIHGVSVLIDCVMGPQTVNALNVYEHKASLLKWMNIMQGAALLVGKDGEDELFASIKERLRKLETFGRGWGRRLSLEN